MIPEVIVNAGGYNIQCDARTGLTINHGRNQPGEHPEPASATIEFVSPDRSLTDLLTINLGIGVYARFPGPVTVTRFAGRITDIELEWEDTDLVLIRVIAVSFMAWMNRLYIGDEPWPQEVDGPRASRILALTDAAEGVDIPMGTADPGTVKILPRDVDRQPALQLLQELASDAGGLVWHSRDGYVNYADAEHRTNLQHSVELDCSDVLMSPQWTTTTDGLVNDTTVSYGVAAEGEQRPVAGWVNWESVYAYGRMALAQETQLVDWDDADERAAVTVIRQAFPYWNMPGIPIELAVPGLDEAQTLALMQLELGDLIKVTGLPSQGPATTASLWVEGWTETIGWGTWRLDLAVSAYCRTATLMQWDMLPGTLTWDTVSPDLIWDTAGCFEPVEGGNRWVDVPANFRWDTVPTSVTWDTWDEFIGA